MPKTPAEWRLLLKRLALVGFALGSVALATAGVVEGLPAAKDWLGFCIAAAVICYAVGGVLYPLGSYFPRDHPTVKHTCRLFKLEDMDLALAFFAEQLGHGLVTEARIQALHKVNERLFYIIESRPSNAATRPQITGCFSILPLKKGGVIHMEAGDYEAALQPTLIVRKATGRPVGLYIGSIIGTDFHSKGFAIRKLREELAKACKKPHATKVFARPITHDGLRLLQKHGFKCVVSQSPPRMNIVCWRLWNAP